MLSAQAMSIIFEPPPLIGCSGDICFNSDLAIAARSGSRPRPPERGARPGAYTLRVCRWHTPSATGCRWVSLLR